MECELASLVASDGGGGFFFLWGIGDGDTNGSCHCVLPVFVLCQYERDVPESTYCCHSHESRRSSCGGGGLRFFSLFSPSPSPGRCSGFSGSWFLSPPRPNERSKLHGSGLRESAVLRRSTSTGLTPDDDSPSVQSASRRSWAHAFFTDETVVNLFFTCATVPSCVRRARAAGKHTAQFQTNACASPWRARHILTRLPLPRSSLPAAPPRALPALHAAAPRALPALHRPPSLPPPAPPASSRQQPQQHARRAWRGWS